MKSSNESFLKARAELTETQGVRQGAGELHGELVRLQEWVKYKGLKVCVVFEGRDGAGKGGTIKAITERVSPRVFRVVALPAPTEREKSQMYVQRYLPHLPAAGEVVIFDRSWYNRATEVHRLRWVSSCTTRRSRAANRSASPLMRMAPASVSTATDATPIMSATMFGSAIGASACA